MPARKAKFVDLTERNRSEAPGESSKDSPRERPIEMLDGPAENSDFSSHGPMVPLAVVAVVFWTLLGGRS